jgi:hypothetical protein
MRSYYFSALVACLPQQWKAIESTFMGGFERRWLTLNIKGRLPLFSMEEPKEEATEILARISTYLKELENKVIVVDSLDLSKYEAEIEKNVADPLKQSVVAEYLEKILAAEIVNIVLDDIIKGDISVPLSIVSHKDRQTSRSVIWTHMDTILDNMGQIWTWDRDKNPSDFFLVCPSKNSGHLGLLSDLILKYDILRNLIRHVVGVETVEEMEMAKLIEKVTSARRNHVAVTMRSFVRDVLGMRNAQWYKPRVEALIEAEVIRVIEHRGKKLVILDPEAKICGNCARWDGLPCDASRNSIAASVEKELYSPLDECRYPEKFEVR